MAINRLGTVVSPSRTDLTLINQKVIHVINSIGRIVYRNIAASVLIFSLAFSISCSSGKTTSTTGSSIGSPGTTLDKNVQRQVGLPLSEKAGWEQEWAKSVVGAKKEGIVVLYSTAGALLRNAMGQAIKNRFGIDLDFVAGRGGEMSAKLLRERASGLYLVDVYIGGATTVVTQLKPVGTLNKLEPFLILPDFRESNLWYEGALRWIDSDRMALAFLAYPQKHLTINTSLVKSEEIKSWRDVLNPKWKGKIVMNDPTIAGIAEKFFAIVGGRLMGHEFMKELAKQEPLIIRNERLQVEWLAHGKYAIGISTATDATTEFQQAGAPLTYITPIEGTWLSSGSGNVSILNSPPHPNAAKVFVNWLLTKEGQEIFSKNLGAHSRRLDVSIETISPLKLRQPNEKYPFYSDDEDFLFSLPKARELASEVFGHLLK